MGVNDRLRAVGYVPLPPLWVRREDMPEIHAIAARHSAKVKAIRAGKRADPREDMEAAWAAFERRKR